MAAAASGIGRSKRTGYISVENNNNNTSYSDRSRRGASRISSIGDDISHMPVGGGWVGIGASAHNVISRGLLMGEKEIEFIFRGRARVRRRMKTARDGNRDFPASFD